MAQEENPAANDQARSAANAAPRSPPPLVASRPTSPEDAIAKKHAREQRDAAVRGVTSIDDMREAIKRVARGLPTISAIPRLGVTNAAAFRKEAEKGLPFLLTGVVNRWPLLTLTPQTLRDRFGGLQVRARVGDYINTAFAADRAMQDMSMLEYLDLVAAGTRDLPPYLGNLEIRELNSMCYWPTYFSKMGPPRFWLGPAGTVTPLHCDYDDNIFAQIWGTKRIFLSPPHHDEFLYPSEANAILFGSPVDPEAPDFDKYPRARQACMIECIVNPGDLLYVPAGWYHQVRALTFSLSANRWARAMPYALAGESSLRAKA